MPSTIFIAVGVLVGLIAGAVVDRVAARWQPSMRVAAAMGAVAEEPTQPWHRWLPVIGWQRQVR